MADAATDGINGFNDKIIAEFRANGGRVSGSLAGTPMILIHHIGARSGIERVTPLACSPQNDGRIVIVASNGGSPTHPSWYYNLRANPRIEVEVGTETFTVLAEELDGTTRAELWPKLITASPSIAEFQAKTTRQIPLFVLTRTHQSDPGAGGCRRRREQASCLPRLASLRCAGRPCIVSSAVTFARCHLSYM